MSNNMTKEQESISHRNHRIAWLQLKACGAIPNNGKKYEYVLHHWNRELRHTNIDRYIQWNLYDLEVISNAEHTRLHMKNSHSLLGKQLSDEHKKKISESLKGRIVSNETRKRLSKAYSKSPLCGKHLLGTHLSIEHRKKISEAMKHHKVSEDTRRKISDTKKEKSLLNKS